MRTGANPTASGPSIWRRSLTTPLRTKTRLIHAHWCRLRSFSRQYREKLMPSLLACSRWPKHARSRSFNASRFHFDIALSTSAAIAPRGKASPGQVIAEKTGLLECLRWIDAKERLLQVTVSIDDSLTLAA